MRQLAQAEEPDQSNLLLPGQGRASRIGALAPLRGEVDADQLSHIVRQARDMIQYIDSARDAVLLVRRASAVDKLVDEALKSCHLLEEEQFELKQEASEAHLRTQRRAGELLSDMLLHTGGRPAKTGSQDGAVSDRPPTLRQLGIDRHESHRWRRIASLPADVFEEHMAMCRSERKELTTSGVVQLANRLLAMEKDLDGVEGRPSGGPALLGEYQKAMNRMSELIWLDPLPLASTIQPAECAGEIERLGRLRMWMDEFESALVHRRGRGKDRARPSTALA